MRSGRSRETRGGEADGAGAALLKGNEPPSFLPPPPFPPSTVWGVPGGRWVRGASPPLIGRERGVVAPGSDARRCRVLPEERRRPRRRRRRRLPRARAWPRPAPPPRPQVSPAPPRRSGTPRPSVQLWGGGGRREWQSRSDR